MLLTRRERPILLFNLLYIPLFAAIAWRRRNDEFLLYVLVILVLGGIILYNQRFVQFPRTILWGLSVWGVLHMAGGLMPAGDTVLYGVVLVPIVPSYGIFRFDQLVHFFGFGVATMVCHHLLKPYVRPDVRNGIGFWMLIVLMGSGFGALNELVEFFAVVSLPETGVGGYDNTMLDLLFNFLGALAAVIWLSRGESRSARSRAEPCRRP